MPEQAGRVNDTSGSWVPDYRAGMREPWKRSPIRDLAVALERIAVLHRPVDGINLCLLCRVESPCETFTLATMEGPTDDLHG